MSIKDIVEKYGLLILDGGVGSEVERRGFEVKDKLWSAKALAEKPELLEQVHYDYFKAGADVGITASYQASLAGFRESGYSDEDAEKFIRKSVQIVKSARERFYNELSDEEKSKRPYPLVIGSLGPYAAYFADGSEYIGYSDKIGPEEFKEFHKARIEWLLDEGVDALAIETTPSLREPLAVLDYLKENHPEVPVWVSFNSRSGDSVSDGKPIKDAAKAINDYEQVVAVGVNCVEPKYVSSLISEIKASTNKLIVVYPNVGLHYDEKSIRWKWKHVDNEEEERFITFSDKTKQWHEEGANLIGGCCNSTPSDIASIAAWARA
ncbi:homocysteine S-methyltransferase [Lachnospiraceae bacterium G11]|nr:homocysteine S-methyltransferase [Lachnospiraceae bacterium G11]